MADLSNSRRRLDKVTYTPLILPESNDGGAALQTAASVGALRLQPGEAELASRSAQGEPHDALALMEAYATATNPNDRLGTSGKLSRFRNPVLAAAVDAIHKQRQRILDDTVKDLQSLIREYQAVKRAEEQANQRSLAQPSERMVFADNPLAQMALPQAVGATTSMQSSALVTSRASVDITPRVTAVFPTPAPIAARLGNDLALVAREATAWTDRNAPERARRFTEIPQVLIPAALRTSAVQLLMEGLLFLIDQTNITVTVKSSLTTRELQPVGLLHLEQLVITPDEVETGELIYSLALAPGERVTLSHKEWSLKQEEYSRFVQDYFENYSERGVAEKTDIAVSSKSETEHSKTMNMSRPLAPGGATLADPVATESVADVSKEKQSQEQSRRDTKEVTQKASSLAVRDQKVSFTVATVTGTEDFTARLYENTHADKVMLIDYFRRMRKWQNQLYRTGIRLTYDVVLPDPGRRLRERWNMVRQIDAQLAAEFQFILESGRGPSPALASVNPKAFAGVGIASAASFVVQDHNIETMSPEDIEYMAREYGVTLSPTPAALKSREGIHAVTEAPPPGRDSVAFEITLDVPDDYRPTKVWIGGRLARGGDNQYMIADYWKGRETRIDADEKVVAAAFAIDPNAHTSNSIPVGFIAYNGAVGEARAFVELTPTPEAWRKWRSEAYAAIRQGAVLKFNEKREALRQQRAAILQELAAPDTLSLRRMEREQIMYAVLEWLFPDFGQNGQMYQSLASSSGVLEYGEYIKFVHDAVDWERILVLLYPYFWDRPENHAVKLYLDHADGTHKEFLRAGACRVILAIKPGYEERLVSLLDRGHLGALAPSSRFIGAIAAVEAAEKEFAARRAARTARGEGGFPADDTLEVGELIGAWYDYTPTSAMDMEVKLKDLM